VHVSLAPTWFDPAETVGIITPFMFLYALHDALVKPIHDKAIFALIWELAFLNGHGPRVAESGLTLITSHPYSSPYEDLTLKGK
jgi:hypothetical protein